MPLFGPALAALLLALPGRAAVVEEFTRLYPVAVERVARPASVEEVRALVRGNPGPISVGGGRYSMGGQTATEGALQLDMRGMDRVLDFRPAEKLITVEAGITWRKLQEFIDPHGLSVKIMQSYANFTVGGALGVNCHGRYVNSGPVIKSVRAIQVVLADGTVVEASPKNRPDVFYGAIGGYGGIGVVTAATLELEPNEPLERTAVAMAAGDYPAFFAREIKGSTTAVFHNGDLYPPLYETVMATTYSRTKRPVTVPQRLQEFGGSYTKDRLLELWISERDYAKRLRASSLDPIRLKDRPVVWRNYEASYDVGTLAPYSRRRTTYVLQEYFVPVERYGDFVPKMAAIFRRHSANVLNVSIRHAEKDPGSVMAWSRGETFAFVVWYKQGVGAAERGAVEVWTRELIDAAIAAGGTYYLPYQIVATPAQFKAAYPRSAEFFALKKRLDPSYKFRNKLWDAYLPPPPAPRAAADAKIRAELAARKDWRGDRAESKTFRTLPEWDIVRASDELAEFEAAGLPSRFPYFSAIRRFWRTWRDVERATAALYPRDRGTDLMIAVIGVSFTVEFGVKGAYEKTVGRLFEALFVREPGRRGSPDLAAVAIAREYGAFLHDLPWYEFPFKTRLLDYRLATAGRWGPRSVERRAVTLAELAVKAVYAKAIKKATGAAYAPEDFTIRVWVRGPVPSRLPDGVKVLSKLGPGDVLLELPRYEKFTAAASALAASGVRFVEIAGNGTLVATVVAPRGWDGARLWSGPVGAWPVLSGGAPRTRVALAVPVPRLHEALADWKARGAVLEHLYDY